MKDPRFKKINELFINYALGNFDFKVDVSPKLDEIDAFISNINMLGEELKTTTISKNHFNNIFNSVSDMLFVLDNKKQIKNINDTVSRKLGYSGHELLNKPIQELTSTRRNLSSKRIKRKNGNTEVVSEFEGQFIGSLNQVVPAYCTSTYLYNENKDRTGFLLIARDLTAIKMFEKSLVQSEERYRKIFEESSDAIFIIDKDGYFLTLNKAGLRLFGFSKSNLKKINYFSLFTNNSEVLKFKKDINEGGILIDVNTKLNDCKKNILHCLVSANIIYGANHEVVGYQGIVKDIRRQKEIEGIVIRTIIDTQEKERERFAQDLHDSLGQQLSGIKFQMEILKKTIGRSKSKSEIILAKSNEALNAAILELRNVCFNLMPRTLEDFGLSYSINDLCRKISSTHLLTFDIFIDKNENIKDKTLKVAIFRIIQEFINNSIKHGKAKKVSIYLKANKGFLSINLKDDGIGFNTKHISEFQGMGLRNVVSRIESYNGDARIISARGKGTIYRIKFPLKQIS
jgi:PAS domain S-box-containing protein